MAAHKITRCLTRLILDFLRDDYLSWRTCTCFINTLLDKKKVLKKGASEFY